MRPRNGRGGVFPPSTSRLAREQPLTLAASAVLALVGLVSGTALVIYFLASVALPLGLAATGIVVAAVVVPVLRRLGPDATREFRRRVGAGAVVGLAATGAYDLTRFALVGLFDLQIRPFEAIPIFGQLITGAPASSAVAVAAGAAYHLANGVGFAVAFAVFAGTRGVVAGVLWAFVLEAAMLTFYPGWLDIRAVSEFASVSVLGHVAYGVVLGGMCRRLLLRARQPS